MEVLVIVQAAGVFPRGRGGRRSTACSSATVIIAQGLVQKSLEPDKAAAWRVTLNHTLAQNRKSCQKSRHFGGIGLQKTSLPGIPIGIPTKRRDSAITAGGNPESRHFSIL